MKKHPKMLFVVREKDSDGEFFHANRDFTRIGDHGDEVAVYQLVRVDRKVVTETLAPAAKRGAKRGR